MELLLIEDVPNLGKRGQSVRVRSGFARNYLLPLNKAVAATAENKAMVEKARVRWLAEEAKLIEELQELAAKIGQLDLKIVAKAAESGHLYGSVNEKNIAEAAAGSGVPFDVRHVRLDQPLKEVGDYQVLVHLHEQVEVTIPVRVRAEGREDWLPGSEEEAAAEEGEAAEADEPAEQTPES
jgi:large subunit ribosomal protein L9